HQALLHQIILQENALHSEKRYRIVVEQALEAIMVVDCQTQRILEVNATLARLLGYDREAMHSLSLGDLIDLSPEEIHTRLAQLNPHQFNDWGSQRYRHQDGSLVDVEVGVNLIRQGSRQAYCFIAHDLSQQKQAEAELYRRAYYDPLTSLPNRTYLLAQLRKTLETDRQPAFVGILFLDLDGFKVINDSLGHTNGDELLKVVAQRLCTCLAPDVTVARFSGDEFVILLNGVDNLQTLTGIAEQVMKTLQEPV
ncbi:MAG: diguanylate cyclase, partial [Thermostichales cyanobacterium SRBZ-1_bins_19]